MLRGSLLVVPVVLLTSTLAASDPTSVTLGDKGLATGAKFSEEEGFAMTMNVEAGGKRATFSISEKRKKRVEVLATKDGVVTKAKVTYDEDTEISKQDGKTEVTPSAIVGKTYTITAGAPLDIQAASGKATATEIAVVRSREQRLMARVLGQTFDKGKSFDVPAADAAMMFGTDPDIEVKKVSLTYVGMDGANARFVMKLLMGSKDPSLVLTIDASGPAVIDPAGNPVSTALEGTVKVDGKLAGKVSISSKRTPTK
jgi:hypothetical protein